jgi:Uncharacterized conserved protein
MARIIYSASKKDFFLDWSMHRLVDKMVEGAVFNHIGYSPSELNSWHANVNSIASLLFLADKVSNDSVIAFEYKVPNGGRIDCMMYGKGEDRQYHVIHIELKQWSNNTVHEIYDNGVFEVEAFTGGGYRAVSHPLKQVDNYHRHLMNYVEALSAPDCHLEGIAYCYNYSSVDSPHDLFAPQYRSLNERYTLYSKDEIMALSMRLNKLLCLGDGLSIFNRVADSRIRPTKKLLDSAANMFKGITEYALLEEQITASDEIYAEVQQRLKNGGKTAIIIKGGPGTGKTVIALKVLAELARAGIYRNVYFTTRSKALRENLKLKLKDVNLGDQDDAANAGDLITNIFDFKPYHFGESEVDVLLIDEAHRIGNSSNFMTDKKYEQTFLSQTMSLLYCSKVCVFFIDDHQAVKSSEIGSSEKIRYIAENYHQQFEADKEAFSKTVEKNRKRLQKKKEKRDDLLREQVHIDNRIFAHTLASLDKDIIEIQSQVDKEHCLLDTTQHFSGKVKVLEIELKTQFRCNGSDNYLDWVDDVVFKPSAQIRHFFKSEDYDFRIFDSPKDLYDTIHSLSDSGRSARVAAGYCWHWSTDLASNGDLKKDVVIGDFKMPWETNLVRARAPFRDMYASSADTWATEPQGINQIGCIFSIQGLELDYIGVIIGPDLDFDPLTDSLVSVPGKNMDVKTGDAEIYDRHIKNIYRVLLTRGTKGCFVYSCNPGVSSFLKKMLTPR